MTRDIRQLAAEHEQGLTTEPQRALNELLRDYDHYLSLRRIPERDPAFKPGVAEFGVWEETATTESKWAFTFPEVSIQNPAGILARVAMGDASKLTVTQRMEALKASAEAVEAGRRKRFAEQTAARRDEMVYVASRPKSEIRHILDGDEVIISDSGLIRSVRTHV